MRLVYYIGKKFYWLGFRMQSQGVRRGISLLTAVGLEWTKANEKAFERVVNGESLEFEIDFTTKVSTLSSAQGNSDE